jgi:hypothetical protein
VSDISETVSDGDDVIMVVITCYTHLLCITTWTVWRWWAESVMACSIVDCMWNSWWYEFMLHVDYPSLLCFLKVFSYERTTWTVWGMVSGVIWSVMPCFSMEHIGNSQLVIWIHVPFNWSLPYDVFEVVLCDVMDNSRRVHAVLLVLKLQIMYNVSPVSQFLSHNMTINFKKLYFEHGT